MGALLLLTAGLLWLVGAQNATGPIGGAWRLTRGDGQVVTDQDFRGRYLLIYFGYTTCRDECPTALAAVADAMRRLGDRGRAVQPVFITVDPAHDTPSVVQRYVRQFGPRLIGLSGSATQIRQAEREYDVSAVPHQMPDAPGGYTVEHTSVLLLVGPDGHYLRPLPADDSGDALAARLRRYL